MHQPINLNVKLNATNRANKELSVVYFLYNSERNFMFFKMMPKMDKLPRVPDAHGDVVDEKIFSDLYIRTSWVDANVALDQIEKVSVCIRFDVVTYF